MMEANKTVIQCKRVFKHPVQKVFTAFMDPLQIRQWFGPMEFSIGHVMVQPFAGGLLEIEMITPKGVSLWLKGTYVEIMPLQKICYRFCYEPDIPKLGESMVAIHFNPGNNETEVSLIHTVYKSIDAVGRAKGWEDGFDKMSVLLDNN